MTYDALNQTLSTLLVDHHDSLDTRAILIDENAIARGIPLLQHHLPQGKWLIAVDENTWQVAGQDLTQALDAQQLPWARFDVQTQHGAKFPMCDDAAVEAYRAAISQEDYVAGIAVGSGTINDIVKARGAPRQ